MAGGNPEDAVRACYSNWGADVLRQLLEPRENHMMFLWQLVNLELWLRSLDTHA